MFENIDENTPWFDDNEGVCELVVQNVLENRKLDSNEEEEEDNANNNLDADSPVIARGTKKCIDLLKKYFIQEGNENNPFHKLKACACSFNQIHTK